MKKFYFVFSFLLLSLFTLSGVLYSKFLTVKAQAAIPQIKLPCDQTDDPEFHSLRPYQAAPCGEANKARYCSNDLIFIEDFDVAGRGDCVKRGQEGTFTCNPDLDVPEHDLAIELDDSMFPIMGNTEQVKNSQTNENVFDDAQKMNEYASWYLNGVNNRAEDFPLSGEDEEDIRKIIDFSGPVNKLLSFESQIYQRIKSVESASTKIGYTDEETGEAVVENERHDQVVGCTIAGIPVPCYGSFINQLANNEKRLTDWQNHLPPLREDYDNFSDYYIEYRRWRGESCARINIPVINKEALFCFNNPLKPDYWSTLFNNIPYTSNEDKKGAEFILDVQFRPAGQTEIDNEDYDYENQRSAPLYFAHTQEVKDLSEILNSTYTPQGVENEKLPKTTELNDCSVVNVRANLGDNLFPGDPDEMLVPGVTYHISQAECKETYEEKLYQNPKLDPNICGGARSCYDYVDVLKCNAEVYITIKTGTKTPNVDKIFSTTVADSGSTFRRMFPKVGDNAPVTCIADIPTVTNVTYDTAESEIPQGGDLTFKVKSNPDDYSGDTPQLTFPHVGSVYEYFLKGIQTALRPKGYGEPITDGQYCQPTDNFGDICAVADAYNIPCCQLEGIMEQETQTGQNMGSGGPFGCCNGSVCGPAQIMAGDYEGLDAGDGLDICDPVGAAELLSRIMLLKQCQAKGQCVAYDWARYGNQLKNSGVDDGDYTAAAYFYGLANGCTVSACTQYRWGAGYGYCDSLESYCKTGQLLPDNKSPEFCAGCSEEYVRAGQPPLDCSP